MTVFAFLINVALLAYTLFTDKSNLVDSAHYVYGAQFLVLTSLIVAKLRFFSFLFLPSLVCFLFLSLSFSLGAYVVSHELGFVIVRHIQQLELIDSYRFIQVYLLISLFLLYLISNDALTKYQPRVSSLEIKQYLLGRLSISRCIFIVLCIGSIGLIGLLGLRLGFGFQLGFLALTLYSLAPFSSKVRCFLYSATVLTFLATNFHSKREVILVLMAVTFWEAFLRKSLFRIKLSHVSLYTVFILLIFGLVIVASVLRGYGGFDEQGMVAAIQFVPKYISSDVFIDSLVDNFELGHTYPTSVLMLDYVNKGVIPLQFGLTIIKPLFLLIPRDIGLFKPESALQLFSKQHDPAFYSEGGSLPVSIVSDLYLNFAVGGVLFLVLLFIIVNKVFINVFYAKSKVTLLVSFVVAISSFVFIRGGGLELWFATFLPATVVILLQVFIKNILKRE